MHALHPRSALLALTHVAALAARAPRASVACVQGLEPNGDWTQATPRPGLGSDPTTETSCVWGELSGAHDVDAFSTWLGFPFPASEWGTPLHVYGSDLLRVTVFR